MNIFDEDLGFEEIKTFSRKRVHFSLICQTDSEIEIFTLNETFSEIAKTEYLLTVGTPEQIEAVLYFIYFQALANLELYSDNPKYISTILPMLCVIQA